jgi:hypothetical protein
MAKDKQKAASRANGALSRGPKTAAALNPGSKARSARSQFSHGPFTQTILLKGESRERFEEIVEAKRTLKPTNPVDELLIGKNPVTTRKCASAASSSAPSTLTSASATFSTHRTWEVQQNTTIPIPPNLKPNLANLKPIPASLIPNPGKWVSCD